MKDEGERMNPGRDSVELTIERVAEALAPTLDSPIPTDAGATRRAAVAMILRPGDLGLETLLIQRAHHPLDPWSGQIAFPGGHQDEGDLEPIDAAIRETREEVGLRLAAADCLGRLEPVSGSRIRPYALSVTPFVFRSPESIALTTNHEVAAALWTPLSRLVDPANLRPYIHPPDPLRREFPSVRLEKKYVLWGMTLRMIASFFERFGLCIPFEPAPIPGRVVARDRSA
jgi:8-oxo-dGTP pyrophosphatase MutT (NUDIX family)